MSTSMPNTPIGFKNELSFFHDEYLRCSTVSVETTESRSMHSAHSIGSFASALERELQPMEHSPRRLEEQFCGWLWMRGARLGRWRHRYFCLNGTMLTNFISFPSEEFLKQSSPRSGAEFSGAMYHFGEGSQPRGVLRIAHVDETDSRSPVGFKIFGTCGKMLEIRAHSVNERNAWLRALKMPARRKSRAWSIGSSEDLSIGLGSFDSEVTCTFDRHSIPTIKSGWIYKRSDVIGRWNRYFFVMQDRMLSYYASDKPYEVPRRRGYVQHVQVTRPAGLTGAAKGQLELVVRFHAPAKQNELRLRFDSDEELDEWREALLALAANASGHDLTASSASSTAA